MVLPVLFVQECLRDQILQQGSHGLKAVIDAKKIERFTKKEFEQWLKSNHFKINKEELQHIFQAHGKEENLSFVSLLKGMRGELSRFRQNLVMDAYHKLDEKNIGYITIERIKDVFNVKAHARVMLQKLNKIEAMQEFLDETFGSLETISVQDFLEYYALLGSTIVDDYFFELIIKRSWKVPSTGLHIDDVENKVKLLVYKHRIRVKDFFKDFDKLRCRMITPTQLASGLDNAKIYLRPEEVKAIVDNYKVLEDASGRVCYGAFCDELDTVFTFRRLEKKPWKKVPLVPDLPGLLPERFSVGSSFLPPEKEARVQKILQDIRKTCDNRRISVRSFFEDAVKSTNSAKSIGHVTIFQFSQALNSKAGLRINEDDMSLLVDKFDDNHEGMVNYIAFASEVDPLEINSNCDEEEPIHNQYG